MRKENNDEGFFDEVRKNFQLVVVVAGIIFSWAYFQTTLANTAKRVDVLEQAQATDRKIISDISGDIKEINGKLDLIINKKF